MKVQELIARLQQEDPEATVTGWDDDWGYHYEVTGLNRGWISSRGNWITQKQAQRQKGAVKVVEVCPT
jgi:hypothetical protein